jgi:hypothetical protein
LLAADLAVNMSWLKGPRLASPYRTVGNSEARRDVGWQTGTIQHLAGTGTPGPTPNGTPGIEGLSERPENMILAKGGELLFTEAGNGRIRRIGPDGMLTTLAGGIR